MCICCVPSFRLRHIHGAKVDSTSTPKRGLPTSHLAPPPSMSGKTGLLCADFISIQVLDRVEVANKVSFTCTPGAIRGEIGSGEGTQMVGGTTTF